MTNKSIIALALIPQILIVNFLKYNPSIIDKYYSDYIFNSIVKANVFLYSSINAPVGEVLYIILLITFLYLSFKALSFRLNDLINLFVLISITYFIFYAFWGLNYFKPSISDNLNLNLNYELIELESTLDSITIKINDENRLIDRNEVDIDIINIQSDYRQNIKKSILPELFLLRRISGHYIPFTSEAIVINRIPKISIPIVIFHEKAHQNGFANEADASFIGFIESIESTNPLIRYSGYFNALLNLLNEINKNYPERLNDYMKRLDKRIIVDINEHIEFWDNYSDNYFDQVSNKIYDFFLKSNNQKDGILSYNKLSNFIIDYYQRGDLY